MNNRVLFVDDELPVLESLERCLRDQRDTWDMAFVQSAEEALAKTEEMDFDAVVTDVTMPGMDGFGLLNALRDSERTSDIPVIIVSGLAGRNIAVSKSVKVIEKPPEEGELLAEVRKALGD